MVKTGWSRKKAVEEMNRVKAAYGVDFECYDKYDFAFTPAEEQKEKYESLKDTITEEIRIGKKRNICIWKTMWIRELEREEAIKEVDETVEKLGITYDEYDSYHLNRYEPTDKEWACRSMQEQEEKQKSDFQRRITELVESRGFTEKQIQDMFWNYNHKYGCFWGEFFSFKLYDLDEETVSTMFFQGCMNKIRRKYNTDKVITRISLNKEWTNHFLAKYITRKWCVNRDITLKNSKNCLKAVQV